MPLGIRFATVADEPDDVGVTGSGKVSNWKFWDSFFFISKNIYGCLSTFSSKKYMFQNVPLQKSGFKYCLIVLKEGLNLQALSYGAMHASAFCRCLNKCKLKMFDLINKITITIVISTCKINDKDWEIGNQIVIVRTKWVINQ